MSNTERLVDVEARLSAAITLLAQVRSAVHYQEQVCAEQADTIKLLENENLRLQQAAMNERDE